MLAAHGIVLCWHSATAYELISRGSNNKGTSNDCSVCVCVSFSHLLLSLFSINWLSKYFDSAKHLPTKVTRINIYLLAGWWLKLCWWRTLGLLPSELQQREKDWLEPFSGGLLFLFTFCVGWDSNHHTGLHPSPLLVVFCFKLSLPMS